MNAHQNSQSALVGDWSWFNQLIVKKWKNRILFGMSKQFNELSNFILNEMQLLLATVLFLALLKPQLGFAETDKQFICRTEKETTQVIPHLFPPQQFNNGSSEFYYEDTKQFTLTLKEDFSIATIKFLNLYNDVIEHNYFCKLSICDPKLRCEMIPFDDIYHLIFGNPKNEDIKFRKTLL